MISRYYHSQNIPSPFNMFSYLILMLELSFAKIEKKIFKKTRNKNSNKISSRWLDFISKKFRIGFGKNLKISFFFSYPSG